MTTDEILALIALVFVLIGVSAAIFAHYIKRGYIRKYSVYDDVYEYARKIEIAFGLTGVAMMLFVYFSS